MPSYSEQWAQQRELLNEVAGDVNKKSDKKLGEIEAYYNEHTGIWKKELEDAQADSRNFVEGANERIAAATQKLSELDKWHTERVKQEEERYLEEAKRVVDRSDQLDQEKPIAAKAVMVGEVAYEVGSKISEMLGYGSWSPIPPGAKGPIEEGLDNLESAVRNSKRARDGEHTEPPLTPEQATERQIQDFQKAFDFKFEFAPQEQKQELQGQLNTLFDQLRGAVARDAEKDRQQQQLEQEPDPPFR